MRSKEDIKAYKKAYRKANALKLKKQVEAWKQANPRAMQEHNLKRYGLTLAQYDEMVAKQDNKCSICGNPEKSKDKNGNIRNLCVDHNHLTNKIRGLLCSNCNNAIGHLKVDCGPELLLKALEYQQTHSESVSVQLS